MALTALGSRVHMFVRLEARAAFTSMFRDVLLCDVVEKDFGLDHPILFVGFPDGSGFSVEFTDDGPNLELSNPIDDTNAFRGAWIEFRTTDLVGFQQRLRAAGIPDFRHPGSNHLYFSAPGGQVFRLLAVDYQGP